MLAVGVKQMTANPMGHDSLQGYLFVYSTPTISKNDDDIILLTYKYY